MLVPLGARTVTGWVIGGDAGTGELPPQDIKDIVEVVDARAFVPAEVVQLALWTAEYYACGPGEALAAAMPPGVSMTSARSVSLTRMGTDALARGALTGPRRALLEQLADGTRCRVDALVMPEGRKRGDRPATRTAVRRRSVNRIVDALLEEGFVDVASTVAGQASAFKTRRVVRLTDHGQEVSASAAAEMPLTIRLGARQRAALDVLRGSADGIDAAALAARGIAAGIVGRLVQHGLVSVQRTRVERGPFAGVHAGEGQPVPGGGETPVRHLTEEQRRALDLLNERVTSGGFHVALVHGVTGSGKTELYLRLARRVQEDGRRVLVLVPEIALTPTLGQSFRELFGERVAIQHSGLPDGERHDQWHRIRDERVDVVVGTRSAVFAPVEALGLVVVDEEHDTSYKQEESPRYNGRDVAIVRAQRAGALVVLGSATPSLESYENARRGRYELIRLERRVQDRPLASVRIVDMREEYAAKGPDVVLSDALRRALVERIDRGEQALVLLNRRGFAVAMLCRQCGETLECPNCSVSLTVHRAAGRAQCHYCNHSAEISQRCDQCGGAYLEHVGFGTERVEGEIRLACPAARVARLDRDTVRRRGAASALLAQFGRGAIDVLVGTQMIAKGHDFPNVTLVGVISADVGLGLADFRAAERTFQLLTQVAGRAGRGDRPGETIVQTLCPDHYSVRHACRQDYGAFFEEEIQFRRAMRYPPEVALVNTIIRAPSLHQAMHDAAGLAAHLRGHSTAFRTLGPAPAPIGRLKGEHRVQLFTKGAGRRVMRQSLQAALAARPELRRRVTVDVDPVSVL